MELETKLRMQKMKNDRKLKHLEEFYLNQIDNLNKKLYVFEKRESYTSYTKEKLSSGKMIKFNEDHHVFKRDVIFFNNYFSK